MCNSRHEILYFFNFIYLVLAALGLHCCVQSFSNFGYCLVLDSPGSCAKTEQSRALSEMVSVTYLFMLHLIAQRISVTYC